MKTTKIILSLALVAITTTAFAQRSSFKGRLFNKNHNQVAYITADYKSETSRTENWMFDLRSWASNRNSRDVYEAPVVAKTLFIENVEVVFEEELGIESWMINTFECGSFEEEIFVESWMSTPFECGLGEEDLFLESWMSTPFECGLGEEELFLESWMSTPLECGLGEEDLFLESWMSIPFECNVAEEKLVLEDWMTTAWI